MSNQKSGGPSPKPFDQAKLLAAIKAGGLPSAEDFKNLITQMDHHQILARVFILDGVPYVFQNSPMKYIIFKEQVASEFDIGSQDVCIVGSARLGFSPSPYKYGKPFSETSDVDVVLISEPLFLQGSQAVFRELNGLKPPLNQVRDYVEGRSKGRPDVDPRDLKRTKEAIRNFVFNNLNPASLTASHPLRRQIFDSISGTTGLFLALEPQVFVSKIRCRVFRTWKAAEDYYTNSLRTAKDSFAGHEDHDEDQILPEDDEWEGVKPPPHAA